jgi:hypothetical protein
MSADRERAVAAPPAHDAGIGRFQRKIVRSLRRRGVGRTITAGLSYYVGDRLLPARRRARAFDRAFDARFGVDTAGGASLVDLEIDSANLERGEAYEVSRSLLVDRLIRCLPTDLDRFVFVDVGSGKGRVVLLASEHPFRRIVGIEFAPQLHEIARRNVAAYRSPTQRCASFELLCIDAVDYELPPEPTVLYLYNPFDESVLRRVLDHARRSVLANPRDLFVLYCNPERRHVLDELGFARVKVRKHYAVYRATGR